jgi:hypothetical protein
MAVAAVPQVLTQQGRLLDKDGNAVDADIAFVFTIYDAATAGNALWTETQTVSVDAGFYSLRLGEKTALPASLFDGTKSLYLGVKVGDDLEMTPRQVITSVPFAMTAGRALTADVATTAASADTAKVATKATVAADSIRVAKDQCTFVGNAYHDCSCKEDELAIGGGACTGPLCNGIAGSALVETLWVSSRVWRVSCENSTGGRIACVSAHVVCLRVAP